MKVLLIGYGEIGKAVYENFSGILKVEIYDRSKPPKEKYDLLLIAYPYSDNFVKNTLEYHKAYSPKAAIIFSTVTIGTTSQIPNAVHLPIEGKHPNLKESISSMHKFVGGKNKIAREFLLKRFKESEITEFERPEQTEAMKLLSTSMYGINIEFARYAGEVMDKYKLNYDAFKEFNKAYNELYKKLGMPEFQRYILSPPEGNIGGHCVVPNAKILDKQIPSTLLKEIYKEK